MSEPQNYPSPLRHPNESPPNSPALTEEKKEISTVTDSESLFNDKSGLVPYLCWVSVISLIVAMVMFGNDLGAIAIIYVIITIFCAALSYRYPRQGLWGLLIYLPFAGTITHWLGDDRPIFHLLKNILFYIPALLGMLVVLIREGKALLINKNLKIPLLIFVGIALINLVIVNGGQHFSDDPRGIPIVMGIFGLAILIGYIPLITCGYYLIQKNQDVYFLNRLQVVLALVCGLLGIAQFWLVITGICPDNSGLDPHLLLTANLQRKCLVGGSLGYLPEANFIRLPGTFVSPWHWTWFLISSAFFAFLTSLNDPKITWQITGGFGLFLIMINAVISGQRTAFLGVPIVLILLMVATSHISRWKRLLISFLAIGLFLLTTLVIFPDLAEGRMESFTGRWRASPPPEFVIDQTRWTLRNSRGLLGNGLGRGTNAARSLGSTQLLETYYSKLIYELGIIGAIAFLILVTTLMTEGFKSYHQIRNYHLRNDGVVFWIFIIIIGYNPYWYPLDTDPVAVYYWLIAGVMLKLPSLTE